MQAPNQLKKSKSKTGLMQKFVDKFKKKRRSKGPAQQPSKELVRKEEKSVEIPVTSPATTSTPTTTTTATPGGHPKDKRQEKCSPAKPRLPASKRFDLAEVTAKAFEKKKKKNQKSKSSKEKGRRKEKEEEPSGIRRVFSSSPPELTDVKTSPLPPAKSPSLVAIRHAEIETANNQKVEKAVGKWIEVLMKLDLKKVIDMESKPIIDSKVEKSNCTAFEKYKDMCQSDHVEVLDSNRVKVEGTDFFYHGSLITVPHINQKIIMAQLPFREDSQCMEAFWLMIAALKMQRVFVILGPDELDKKTFHEYFPDDFFEHKTIRVNNRKTSLRTEEQNNDQLYYEVVPKDCAEAPFAMLEICDFWPDGKIPTISVRPANTAATFFESDIDPDATIGVVSHYGAGRPGAFVVGALAIERLRAGEVPNIKDLASMIRAQRPGAIETLPQYFFCFLLPLSFSLKHVTNQTLKGKIEKMVSQLEALAFGAIAEEDEEEDDDSGTPTTS